jgi:hypothetical protein
MRERRLLAVCNPGPRKRAQACRFAGCARGTPDAVRREQMKDIVLIAVTVAFFALSWIYARSFDHL